MGRQLKCFLSTSYDTDISLIKSVLSENNIEVFDLFDFSIGSSIQDILKEKLKQSDFAVFVVSKDNKNVLYEMGVCEGLGKPSLIIINKEANFPFYIENKLSLTANLADIDFLRIILLGFIDEIKLKRKPLKTTLTTNKFSEKYSNDIKTNLYQLLEETKQIRINGQGRELESVIENIFRATQLNYVDNTREQSSGVGVDFALWNDKLGRIIGNPIIVEVKFGRLTYSTIKKAEHQIRKYADKSDAKIALLLYLDKLDKRFKIDSSLNPLIIAYDIEDFINSLLESNFESVLLTSRNKIAHGE